MEREFISSGMAKKLFLDKSQRPSEQSSLIYGERGLGKTTLAKLLAARFLIGEAGFAAVDFPASYDYALVKDEIHPDLFFIDNSAANTKVDDVRALSAWAQMKPNQSEKKVIIIKSADLLPKISQNALLKLLEDPPKNTVLILTAERENLLLPTVLSRLRRLRLLPLKESEALAFVKERLAGSQGGDIQRAAELYPGNIGRMLEYLQGGEDEGEEVFAKAIDFICKKDSYALLILLEGIRKERDAYNALISRLFLAYEGAALTSGHGISAEEKLSKALSGAQIYSGLKALNSEIKNSKINPNIGVSIMNLLLGLSI